MLREDFLKYQAKTTPHPLGISIKKGKGVYLTDTEGKNISILLLEFPHAV